MILRALAIAALIAVCAAVAIAALVLAASVLRPIIAWIAADERIAWGTVATFAIIGLAVIMEGRKRQ